MPIDINWLRADKGGFPDKIRESQRRRFASVELVDEIIAKDDRWRFLTGQIDNLKKKRNAVQKDVAQKKKAGEECESMVAEIKNIGDEITRVEEEQEGLKKEIDSKIGKIGNIVDDSVPVSQDEDKDNLVVRTWGTPRNPAGLLNHHDLLWRIGGYEPDRGVAVAGHRAYFLRDVGVMLNQAFINYGIAFLRARNYTVVQPPYFMKKEVMAGVAQLEQFDEELYKVGGDGDGDKYLIATSEQPICGYYMNEWLQEKELPIRMSGISTCFRKEAGSHGKDTWGIFRVHQFEKVEQFAIVENDIEKSKAMQEEMIATAEAFYQSLGFPYHVISIVSGALNNAAIKKLDLEAWFPGYNAYRELVSCSNCTDYQSRAMEIRCGVKKMGDTQKKYVHMLNATLCATGRAICCLLENYQEADGVRIPEVLVPFMGGMTFLPFVRDSKPVDKAGSAGTKTTTTTTPAATTTKPPTTAAATTTTTASPPASVVPVVTSATTGNAEVDRLAELVRLKGEEIRALKAAKGSKDDVKVLVDQLTALKLQHSEVAAASGIALPTPPTPATTSTAKAEKKKDTTTSAVVKKDKPVEKKSVNAPSTAPTNSKLPPPPTAATVTKVNPVSTTPTATATPTARPALIPPSSIWKNPTDNKQGVDLVKFELWLQVYSFAGGYTPTQEDNRVLTSLAGSTDYSAIVTYAGKSEIKSYPAILRWLRVISITPPSVMPTWK